MPQDDDDISEAGARPRRTVVSVVALATPGLGLALPFLGPWLSMLLIGHVVRTSGARLWVTDRTGPRLLGLLAGAALWGPGLLALAFLLLVGERLGSPETERWLTLLADVVSQVGVTYWLFLPLAGPGDIVTPALVGLAVLASGATASAAVRRPWPYLAGALSAPIAYGLTLQMLDIPFVS